MKETLNTFAVILLLIIAGVGGYGVWRYAQAAHVQAASNSENWPMALVYSGSVQPTLCYLHRSGFTGAYSALIRIRDNTMLIESFSADDDTGSMNFAATLDGSTYYVWTSGDEYSRVMPADQVRASLVDITENYAVCSPWWTFSPDVLAGVQMPPNE